MRGLGRRLNSQSCVSASLLSAVCPCPGGEGRHSKPGGPEFPLGRLKFCKKVEMPTNESTIPAFMVFMVRSLSKLHRNLFASLIGLISLAPTANAYVTNGKSWPANATLTLQFSLGLAPAPLLDGNTSWNAAAAPAIDAWNAKMARLQIVKVMDSPAAVASGDRVNSIAFSNSVFGQSFGSGTLAVAYYFTQGSTFLEVDVLFNRAQTFDSYRGPLRFGGPGGYATGDIRRVLLHELGHGLGLEHASGDNVMSPITSDREVLSSDDIAGIQSIYGVPAPAPNPTPTPTPIQNAVRNDFNQDRSADLVWQNRITGERGIWLMNGSSLLGVLFIPTVSVDWEIATTGDFNGDGKTDLVWQNVVTGQRGIWLMNGHVPAGEFLLPTVPTVWQIVATGDFNGDGKSDLVWQNTVTGQRGFWFMNGTTYAGERFLPTVPTEWEIAGVNDFNGDGQLDLIWQNKVNGQRGIWFMNGSTYIGERMLPSASTAWTIAGTGDYNGDGQPDLIWQNTVTGQRGFWLLNGATYIGEGFLPTIPTYWEIRNH